MTNAEEDAWKKIYEKLGNLWNDKIESYIRLTEEDANQDEDFSWIEDDASYIGGLENNPISLKYGIPIQVKGDPQTARVFLCLFNPSVADESRATTLSEYCKIEDEGKKEENKHSLKRGLVVTDNNILETECQGQKETQKEGYYYKHYYKSLLSRLKKENTILNCKKLKDLPVCNLELVPYRSKKRGKLTNTALLKNSEAVKLTVQIIIQRLKDYHEKSHVNKPVFFMRSVSQYRTAFNYYLEGLEANKKVEIDGRKMKCFQDLIDLGNDDKGHFFFQLTQSGSITNKGLRPIFTTEEIQKIDNEYEEIVQELINDR